MFELIPFNHNIRRVASFDPFRAMDEMEHEMFNNANAVSSFRTDVEEKGDSFILEAELPGIKKENIDLNIENDCLTISAARKAGETEQKRNYIKRERFYGSFCRSFDVSGIDIDKIEASYNDGILTIVMPKKGQIVPPTRKLEIK